LSELLGTEESRSRHAFAFLETAPQPKHDVTLTRQCRDRNIAARAAPDHSGRDIVPVLT
jgi:hypothetical protein